ncbi:lanthionine synthetase LanC family protein [Corynebacterium sp. CNJ-954]|uniref:lanthionine synthetase LanC family protein n=1 Tax=Corynebacterium sp. CNJ-954 TaxID=1904962 RepID=UPI00096ABAD5|nr:lanthionine synthetase LanC family protein [Corynebacterium sp. CNJ-954]
MAARDRRRRPLRRVAGILLALNSFSEDETSLRLKEAKEACEKSIVAAARLVQKKGLKLTIGSEEPDLGLTGVLGGLLRTLPTISDSDDLGNIADICRIIGDEAHLQIYSTQNVDVVGGLSGLIIALHRCGEKLNISFDEQIRDTATRICDVVVDRALFTNSNESGAGLLGFAHGSSGVVYALSIAVEKVGSIDDRKRIFSLLERISYWESAIVDRFGGTWPDLREDPSNRGDAGFNAWCHGSAGALICWSYVASKTGFPATVLGRARRLMSSALEETINSLENLSYGSNHSLCHGASGNIAILNAYFTGELAQPNVGTEAPETSRTLASIALAHRSFLRPWCSGAMPGVRNQGLFMGMSGTLLSIASVSDPELLRGVLW